MGGGGARYYTLSSEIRSVFAMGVLWQLSPCLVVVLVRGLGWPNRTERQRKHSIATVVSGHVYMSCVNGLLKSSK